MKLYQLTWPLVEHYLRTDNRILIPIGSTEQHGPTGLIGTDFLTAQHIAERAGEQSQVMVASPICYGMAAHHMAFPGTVSLAPQTLIRVIADVVSSLGQHGFRKFLFVNGHGGNSAILTSAFCQIKSEENFYVLETVNWWTMPEVQAYETQHYGAENGFHATISEVAATQVICPQAFEKIPPQDFKVEPRRGPWPMSPGEFRQYYPDGRMGSNPGRANISHGENVLRLAIDGICQRLQKL